LAGTCRGVVLARICCLDPFDQRRIEHQPFLQLDEKYDAHVVVACPAASPGR
jgi:hypothetical protein